MTLLLGAAAADAAVAGSVLFTLGRVEVQRGNVMLTAQRGSTVEEGDVVSTGPTGMGQIRFKDGTLLALKPGASMQIEEFKYQPAPITPAAPSTQAPLTTPSLAREGSRSVLRLLKGAFRTITGAIGKSAGDDYRVITPSATIGIRGTDYSVAYCSGDCGKTRDGLYVGVSNGEIFVTNDVGQLVLGDNQYAYVKDSTTPPDQQVAPPEVLELPIEGEEGEEGEEGGEEPETGFEQGAGDDGAPIDGVGDKSDAGGPVEYSEPEGNYELQPGEPGVFAFGTGPLQGAATFVSAGANGIYTDDQGRLIGFLAPDTTGVTFYSIGTATNAQHGFDPDTSIQWGRWSAGTARVGGQGLDLSNQSLHWIYAAESSIPVLPISGTATYSLVGNTNPTDSAGAVGFLGGATFAANFTNQTVASTLAIGFGDATGGGAVWQASGSGIIFANTPLFAGNYSSVSVNNLTAGNSGSFSGFFTDNALGAGLSYSLTNGTTTVSGAAAFGNPNPGAP